jgi:uncharacterized protein
MSTISSSAFLPAVAGIGLRSPHMAQILETHWGVGWLEVHAENYMNFGPATATLERVREQYRLAVHGVGLSLGSARGIDDAHLARLKEVCDRLEPAMVSEHLAWSVGDGIYLSDLLPVPYDEEALCIVCQNIERTQDAIKRSILIENLSAYVGFACSTMAEPQFLTEIVKRTGCGLLLDVNNVYVSAYNLGFNAEAYIAALPSAAIGEVHLAGHAENDTPDGKVLIDSHGSCIASEVWSLYCNTIKRFGPRPTLIEWDSDLPPLATLLGEAMWADLLAGMVAGEAGASECRAKTAGKFQELLPPTRNSAAGVSVCDHHPMAKQLRGGAAHA